MSSAHSAPPEVSKFVKRHCLDCHTGESAEAGLDLSTLSGDLTSVDGPAFSHWVRILDRVRSGEMPPQDAEAVPKAERKRFVSAARPWLHEHQTAEWAKLGRVRGRRLTNLQLERSLHDLLGVDVPLAERMPQEAKASGFNTVVAAQTMSRFHLQEYMKAVDLALDESFRRGLQEERSQQRQLNGRALARRRNRRRTREPEFIDGHAVTWAARTNFYGRIPSTTARDSGWYRFKIRAKGLNVPVDRGVWCSVRSGQCISGAPLLNWVGAFRATEETGEWTFEAWIQRGHMLEIRPGDATLKLARFRGGQIGNGEGGPQNVAGIAIERITMERVYRGPSPAVIRSILVDDLGVADGEAQSENPAADLSRLMLRFSQRAFRRPVKADEIEQYVGLAKQSLQEGKPFTAALRVGYRALLCSPRFMYLNEQPGELGNYALASRLSYFLWNSMPDARLLRLAADKQLTKTEVLKSEVQRMLSDKRGRQFVRDFASQWLDLSEINATTPDRRLHRNFDLIVQHSMIAETQTFLQDLLDRDANVRALIRSQYTFLNERLARYYRISGVDSDTLTRTTLKPEDHRGGVLTHGAVLKVTANGTTTSPVVRGVWISERLLGEHIPPPPAGVPAIEPDVRGAKTIREMLDKHKSDAACASCHRLIDPAGFALENFDPAGRWRASYLKTAGRRVVKGPPVDASHQLASGEKFAGLRQFQAIVAANPHKLAVNLAEKLIAYGTGAAVTFADRSDVHAVARAAGEHDYGFRSIVEEVVCSRVFRMK